MADNEPEHPVTENTVNPDLAETDDGKGGFMLREILESVVIAVVLAILIKLFLFQNFAIPSGSMEPTLYSGDYIGVNKIIYKLSEPKRGDVIVFKYPIDPKREFVKRLIGLPGETIQIRDNRVFIDNKIIEQPFLPVGLNYPNYGPFKIPSGKYFMMGDNRPHSNDSRSWGTVPQNNIIGKAIFIYWPVKRMQVLH